MGIRSLFAGVSGLRNFQSQLDVIGNNIANGQTAGYKSTRMTFQDLLSQTQRGATSPGTNVGGTNPVQFGLGASIGAIDTDFTQGNLLTTGRQMDLAISGNGFFKVSDGADNYYTRAGAFDIDEAGNMVSTTSGFIVQGYNATQGVLDLTNVTDITIPVGVILPAQATTDVSMVGNLNSTDDQSGSLHESQTMLATELNGHDSDIDGLFAAGTLNSRIAGLQPGITTVTVASLDGAAVASNFSLTYVTNDAGASDDQFNSIEDLVQELNFRLVNGFTAVQNATTGAIDIIHPPALGGTGSFNITSTNSALAGALAPVNDVAYLAAGETKSSDDFTHTAVGTDLVADLRDSSGINFGLAGTTITVSGDVGDQSPTSAIAEAGQTLDVFNGAVATGLGIALTNSVSLVDGKFNISGDGGTDYDISNLNFTTGGGSATFDAYLDNTTGNWTKLETATDNHVSSFIAHDSDGVKHTVTMKFNIRESSPGTINWVWDAHSVETSSGAAENFPLAGVGATRQSGVIQFNDDGSRQLFSPGQITISPISGTAQDITINLDTGTAGAYDGLVSFENESSARFSDITGYASGELQNISVNADGVVLGNFSNGQNQTLAQMVLAMFDNPSGLEKVGGNNYVETLNSGAAVDGLAGNAGRGILIPSTLEASNVDLAREFVSMITAQRGFQSNARIITTANDFLGELVNLVR